MLTWPEILRQFALSAGFGPQLKRRNFEQAYLRDENEVHFFVFDIVVLVLLFFIFLVEESSLFACGMLKFSSYGVFD